MTNEELERAVERLADVEAVLRLGQGGIARGTGYARRVASDLRALLFERAELLAAVKRMLDALRLAVGPLGSTGPTPVYEAVLAAILKARAALTTGEEK